MPQGRKRYHPIRHRHHAARRRPDGAPRDPGLVVMLPAPLPEAEVRRRWEALQKGDTGAFDDVPLVPVKPA